MDMIPLFLAAAGGLTAGWFFAHRATAKAASAQQDRLTQTESDLAALRAKELMLSQSVAKLESERDAARDNTAKAEKLLVETSVRENEAREKLAGVTAAKDSLEKELASAGALFGQRVDELNESLAALKKSEQDTRASLDQALRELATAKADAARSVSEAKAKDEAVVEIRATHEKELKTLRDQKEADLASLKTAQEQALKAMEANFKVLSADTLKAQLPEMLKGAETLFQKFQANADGDFKNRRTELDGLLAPLKESLESYRSQIREGERMAGERIGEVKSLVETLTAANKTLADETGQFRMVLKSSQSRGRWGELMLERVFESAGMQRGIHYIVQNATRDDKRPDMIVKLPQSREIIIDSKVPDFDAIGELCETTDPVRRLALCKEFAQKLRVTAKKLAERDYPAECPNALDHVILFLPAESLFAAALEGDKDIVVALSKQRILLATPASILAMIHAVLISWRQHNQEENARSIAEVAGQLYARCVTLINHWRAVGAGLRSAAVAYNESVGSYNSRLLPTGKELESLGILVINKETKTAGGKPEKKNLDTLMTVEFEATPLSLSEVTQIQG